MEAAVHARAGVPKLFPMKGQKSNLIERRGPKVIKKKNHKSNCIRPTLKLLWVYSFHNVYNKYKTNVI